MGVFIVIAVVLILLAAAAVVLVPYVATYHRPGPSDPLDALTSPREAIEFALCVLGIASYMRLGVEQMPDIKAALTRLLEIYKADGEVPEAADAQFDAGFASRGGMQG